LTHLALRHVDCLALGVPPELGTLPALQRFCWLQQHEEEAASPGRTAARLLPAGPWLLSLRQAALTSATAAASLAVLSGATALEELVVVDTLGSDSARSRYERHPAIAAWAASHPSLRLLGVCASELPWLAERTPAWQELAARVAPALDLRQLAILPGTPLMAELGFLALDTPGTTF
jgi:hypothetical protein